MVPNTDIEDVSNDIPSKQKVNFAYPWSRNMPFEQLVENCFSKNGLFDGIGSLEYFIEGGHLILNEQILCKADEIGEEKPSADYVYELGVRIVLLYYSLQLMKSNLSILNL